MLTSFHDSVWASFNNRSTYVYAVTHSLTYLLN